MHGVKRLFGWMIPRFDRSRFRVSLVSLRQRDLSEETLDALGINITYLGKSKFDPTTLPALLRVIREQQIDLLHLHGYGATTFGRIAAALRGLPVVLHEHANLTDTPWFQKVADRLLEPVTDVALAVSKSTADFVVQARRVRPARVRVVYLGAPLDEFGVPRTAEAIAETRRSLGVAASDVLVGSVTRLHDSKGNAYLVEAAQAVIAARPQARFIVFGEGPLRASLEADVARRGLGDRFRFAGFVKDVAAVMWAFDIAAFPSLWEGTPLTVFEALATARPIVATNADGLSEVLVNDVNAVVVPTRDAAALAARIVELIDQPARRATLGQAARRSAAQYDINAFVRKMEQLYVVLHRESRARRRHIAESSDLAFLTDPPHA